MVVLGAGVGGNSKAFVLYAGVHPHFYLKTGFVAFSFGKCFATCFIPKFY